MEARSARGLFAVFGLLLIGLLLQDRDAKASASTNTLELTRAEAERDALRNSDLLKSFADLTDAATERMDAQYSLLFPRLAFNAYYAYLSHVPQQQITNGEYLNFGAHDNYMVGPFLSYTLWDTFSSRKSYYGSSKVRDSRDSTRRSEELQVLFDTQSNYVGVQEALEELRAVSDSLRLSLSQNEYITSRFKSGAATHLERIESEREVLSYRVQFTQKQADLAKAVRDLLALTKNRTVTDLSHPGAAGIPNSTLELKFDSLQASLEAAKGLKFAPPEESHPRIASQELLAQSAELQAQSIKAGVYPTVRFRGGVTLQYPNGTQPEQVNQNLVLLTASIPLFEMNHTRHLAAEKQREADSARHQKDQIRTNLLRDYEKAQEQLVSLMEQQDLSRQDVVKAAEAARLYYSQYKGGKAKLIDVQSANNRSLLARLNKARIDAQILNQFDQLRILSGKGNP